MAVTATQTMQPASVCNIAVGSYLQPSTAAAFTITTGFAPRYVRVANETGACVEEWYYGMADAEAMKLVGDTSPATYAIITSHGITPTSNGFTVGLDTDINVTSQQLSWLALG